MHVFMIPFNKKIEHDSTMIHLFRIDPYFVYVYFRLIKALYAISYTFHVFYRLIFDRQQILRNTSLLTIQGFHGTSINS